jgi:hypothetical protein
MHRPKPRSGRTGEQAFREWKQRQREFEERLAEGAPITAEMKAESRRRINASLQAQGLPPVVWKEPEAKPVRRKRKLSERKAWALGQLRDLIKGVDLKPQQTLLKRWQKKYGRIRDRATRERLQRSFLRWRDAVSAEIAAEKNRTFNAS